eukprot:467079_1
MSLSVHVIIFISISSSIGLSSNCSVFTSEPSCTPNNVPSSQQCEHVKNCCNDMIGEGIIPYFKFVYCDLHGKKIFYLPFLIVSIIYLLIITAIISQHYFAELMQEITKYLHLRPNVAGATLVAWGNGIATMSSSIAAISYGGEAIKLGLGALFGVSVFNISFICATISLIAPYTIIDHYSLLRDGSYLILVCVCIIMIYFYGKINLLMSILLLTMYIAYVLCIWITSIITNYLTKKKVNASLRETAQNVLQSASTNISSHPLDIGKEETQSIAILLSVSKSQRIRSILQIRNKLHIVLKIMIYIIGFPVFIVWQLLKLTVPLPNYTHWNDMKACLHCITIPILFYFAFIFIHLDRQLKFITIPLITGCLLSLIVCIKMRFKKPKSLKTLLSQRTSDQNESTYGTIDAFQVPHVTELSSKIISTKSKDFESHTHEHDSRHAFDNDMRYSNDIMSEILETDLFDKDGTDSQQTVMYNQKYSLFEELSKQPVMKGLFLFLSFVSLITWIKIISEELISILAVLGTISEIDLTLLGIFILSSVNSIPDLMNNVSVALKGNPKMAIAACFGGSSLEISIGFGIGTLIGLLKNDTRVLEIRNSLYVMIGCFCTIAICIIYIALVFFHKWKLNKMFGTFGYLFYLSFLIVNVLISYITDLH